MLGVVWLGLAGLPLEVLGFLGDSLKEEHLKKHLDVYLDLVDELDERVVLERIVSHLLSLLKLLGDRRRISLLVGPGHGRHTVRLVLRILRGYHGRVLRVGVGRPGRGQGRPLFLLGDLLLGASPPLLLRRINLRADAPSGAQVVAAFVLLGGRLDLNALGVLLGRLVLRLEGGRDALRPEVIAYVVEVVKLLDLTPRLLLLSVVHVGPRLEGVLFEPLVRVEIEFGAEHPGHLPVPDQLHDLLPLERVGVLGDPVLPVVLVYLCVLLQVLPLRIVFIFFIIDAKGEVLGVRKELAARGLPLLGHGIWRVPGGHLVRQQE